MRNKQVWPQQYHKKIAILNGRKSDYVTEERFRGYRETLHTYGIELEEHWVKYGNFTTSGGYEAVKDLYQANERSSTIYSSNKEERFKREKPRKRIPGSDVRPRGRTTGMAGKQEYSCLPVILVVPLKFSCLSCVSWDTKHGEYNGFNT